MTIPVLQLGNLSGNDECKKQEFLARLDQACRSHGFFALRGTGIDSKILAKAYASHKKFFKQNLEQKQKYSAASSSGQRGFVQSEVAQGEGAKDWKEFYHIGRELNPKLQDNSGIMENIWPSDDFRSSMICLQESLHDLAHIVADAIFANIAQNNDELSSEFLSTSIEAGDSLLRAIHYPSNPPPGVPWAAAHTDIDLFTLLPPATCAGLKVKYDDEWIDVNVPEDAVIVNVGDMLQNLTNGVYVSSVHKVEYVANNYTALEGRDSLVYFVHPNLGCDLSPLAKYIAERGEQYYPNATQSQLLTHRLLELGLCSPDSDRARELLESGYLDELSRAGMNSARELLEQKFAVHTLGLVLQ